MKVKSLGARQRKGRINVISLLYMVIAMLNKKLFLNMMMMMLASIIVPNNSWT